MKNYTSKSIFLIIYFFNSLICAFVSFFKHSNNYFLESDFWFSYFFVLLITLSVYKNVLKVINNVVFLTLCSVPFIFFSMFKSLILRGFSFKNLQTQTFFLISIFFVIVLNLIIFNKKFLDFQNEIIDYFKNIKKDKKLIFIQICLYFFILVSVQLFFN